MTSVSFSALGEDANRIIRSMEIKQPHYSLDINSENLTSDFQNLFEKIKSTSLIKSSAEYRHSKLAAIPRRLTFSSRWWMGTAGGRVARASNMTNVTVQNGRLEHTTLKAQTEIITSYMHLRGQQSWTLDKRPMTEAEKVSVKKFKQTFSAE